MVRNSQLDVCELFYSIQGESSYSGYPCVFIRLAGCNLRCSYCDARYSYTEDPEKLSIADIITFIDTYPDSIIEVTGGEPLLQDTCFALIERLVTHGKEVLIETNGTVDFSPIPLAATVITDIKCPGSGVENRFLKSNYQTIKERNTSRYGSCEVKFVLTDEHDYNWAKDILYRYQLVKSAPILFSPVSGQFSARKLAGLLLKDQLPVRLQIQLHSYLWPESTRGV